MEPENFVNLNEKSKLLYTIELPQLIKVIEEVRDYHSKDFDYLSRKETKDIDDIAWTVDSIVIIYSTMLVMNGCQGSETLFTMMDSTAISSVEEFQDYTNKQWNQYGYKNDTADCFKLAYIVDKIRNDQKYSWCATSVLLEIICKFIIDHQKKIPTNNINMFNISDIGNLNLLLLKIDQYYKENSYIIFAGEILSSNWFSSYIHDNGSMKDLNFFHNDLIAEEKIEIMIRVLRQYQRLGNDYTMYGQSKNLITKEFIGTMYGGG